MSVSLYVTEIVMPPNLRLSDFTVFSTEDLTATCAAAFGLS